ncbi:formate dehydrogenase accessory protein FdhE [Stutzerimonas nosocomialis]|uniref:Protein FdhE homolog n=1 Tax=Stutzerimonas nosocomialis TaxID=1056496 RepID=A0A5R9QB43_9GAMM|nr:formate dehydrogenase accessory protein FdhE [Stutzerimonas nosocomialis]TLX61905.1 formate dehydrogenase accessory protein FdhE [Stutzerimonas nosocomialis]
MAGQILEPEQIAASAATPPFIHLPPARLFALRTARLETLAEGNPLGDYLRLVAGLCRAQQQVLDNPPVMPERDENRLEQSRKHGMPPLAADTLVREDAWLTLLDALLRAYPTPDNPQVKAALEQLKEADAGQRRAWAVLLLAGQYDGVPAAVVPFLGAGLQVAWSHWLLDLPEDSVSDIGSGSRCPCCGSPAMAGVIRHRGKHNGLRYLVCSLCACEWHFVRVKCTGCESSEGLDYVSLETDKVTAEKAPLKAETCPSCKTYFKQVYLELDADAEALSADLASLTLDMRLDAEGFQRQAPNLLLAPGGE